MLLMQTGYGRAASMQVRHETYARRALYIAPALPDDAAMENHKTLAQRLVYCRALPGAWMASYDALINRLRHSGATKGAPAFGDVVPDFVLPDGNGKFHRLSDLVAAGPAVLSFNRGSWCPYCQEEIGAWSEHRDALRCLGGRLIIITPEAGGRMQTLADIAGTEAVVLCDIDLGVALNNGLAFPVGRQVLQEFRDDGLDLTAVNGTAAGFLPVPATFVLDKDRKVHFAFVEPDFTQRAEPADVLAAVSALAQDD